MVDVEGRLLTITNVGTLHVGSGAALMCAKDLAERGARSVFLVTTPPTLFLCDPLLAALRGAGIGVTLWHELAGEPTMGEFAAALDAARACAADAVVGLGGGSAMDVAKLVAALFDGAQALDDVVGVDLLKTRGLWVGCIPTTAGTGSEATPIAILGDEAADLKKGVVSRHLVPDAAYLDPQLTVSMPPAVTAATGLDALTHCIEAFANRFAHPLIDLYALSGMTLIADNLERAVRDGTDLAARTAMLRASYYGGLCLGPVNTAAVHALAYPLGGEFHIPHGVANSLLLPHVLRFNVDAAPVRYAAVAAALGVSATGDPMADALAGVERIIAISDACGIKRRLSDFGIAREAIPRMASAAITVTRLLNNNPRTLTEADVREIYEAAW
jgi:alcohol dehydrogenase class IV